MKVAICQMKVVAKRPDLNVAKMKSMMDEAKANGAELAAFPELCIPGYMIGDAWEDFTFIQDCMEWEHEVTGYADCTGIGIVYGNVYGRREPKYEDGRGIRGNAAVVHLPRKLCKDTWPLPPSGIHSVFFKRNMPSYREFDDKRYFASIPRPDDEPLPETGNGYVISASVCEDGWDSDYEFKPLENLRMRASMECPNKKHLHFNLSCSPFTLGKNAARNRKFVGHAKCFKNLFYVNNVGIQNNGKNIFVFDGCSTIYNNTGAHASLPPLKECIGYTDLGYYRKESGPWQYYEKLSPKNPKVEEPLEEEILAYGIKEFLNSCGIRKVVIGLSGGIDSALSAMLHVKAIGKENVYLVNMPSKYNSDTTKSIAKEIADNLGCCYFTVPITKTLEALKNSICSARFFKETEIGSEADVSESMLTGTRRDDSQVKIFPGTTLLAAEGFTWDEENTQARLRGAGVLASLASGLGAVFPNNGNKAETAVGYCTLLGDHAGYLAPLADLWKGDVYRIARRLSNDMGEVLPESIFTLKPSAELSTEHSVDEDKGDPIVYWYHDKLFASWIEPWNRRGIEGSLEDYCNGSLLRKLGLSDREKDFEKLFPTGEAFIEDLEKWWKLFNSLAVAKRVQAPPVLTLTRRSFGFDFRESITGPYFSRRYLDLKRDMLSRDAFVYTTHT